MLSFFFLTHISGSADFLKFYIHNHVNPFVEFDFFRTVIPTIIKLGKKGLRNAKLLPTVLSLVLIVFVNVDFHLVDCILKLASQINII